MTNFEIIQTIANVATALTFGAAAWQLWESNKQTRKSAIQKRSEYVINLYNTFINDKDMVEIYYKLEYSEFRYDDNFHGSQTEKQLDKLLGHFSNIGRLFNLGILTREDLKFFEYEFLVIYQNKNIQAYLRFLDNWFKLRQINIKKFEYFRLTGQAFEKENNIQLKKN
ncbi:MAG: hypothetical protein ABIK31_07390 [candidate division WOR-3 bacterium]